MGLKFDFSGWATKNDILCADGRTIRKNAFADQDGTTVPLVWSHRHDGPENVIGHAYLENRPDGVYTYCAFNDTPKAQQAKIAVQHGDITNLSIYANQLKQNGGNVMHGVIREVSLVLAGANPGAWIDVKSISHSDNGDDEYEAEMYTDDSDLILAHSICGEDGESAGEVMGNAPKTIKSKGKKKNNKKIRTVADEIDQAKENGDLEDAKDEADDEAPVMDDPEPVETPKTIKKKDKGIEHSKCSSGGSKSSCGGNKKKSVCHAAIPAGTFNNEEDNTMDNERTVQDVFDEMTDEQKTVVYALIGQALEDQKDDDAEEMADELAQSGIYYDDDIGGWFDMKANVFDDEVMEHSGIDEEEMSAIFADAKTYGNLRDACLAHGIEDLCHTAGPEHGDGSTSSGNYGYGFNNWMPEAQMVGDTPYVVSRPLDWAEKFLAGARKVPFSKIKSMAADLTANEARAKGYVTGNQKVEEVIKALKRETSPTTIYKLQKIDRDDILDIKDFDVVAFIKDEMKGMLRELKAQAMLVGDHVNQSPNQVNDSCIRPIWGDDATYTLYDTDASCIVTGTETASTIANLMIERGVRMREGYYGSGNLTLFLSRQHYNDVFLLKDLNGHRLYKTEQEVAAAFNVSSIAIVPAGIMDNLTKSFTISSTSYTGKLWGIMVDLKDYTIGSVRDGNENFFDDFNIDYNQMKYLIEERCSGALTAPKSAIALMTLTAAG